MIRKIQQFLGCCEPPDGYWLQRNKSDMWRRWRWMNQDAFGWECFTRYGATRGAYKDSRSNSKSVKNNTWINQ